MSTLFLKCIYLTCLVLLNVIFLNVIGASKDIDNLCPRILRHVFEGYVPIGNKKAGNFTSSPNATTILDCVTKCCELGNNCNVAFMYDKKCYHVKCATNDLCIPFKRLNTTSIQLVLINPVLEDDPSWSDILKTYRGVTGVDSGIGDFSADIPRLSTYPDKIIDPTDDIYLPYSNELTSDVGKRLNEYLDRANSFPYNRFLTEQYLNDDNDLQADETKYFSDYKALACEVGIDTMCSTNEECYPITSQSRQGICNCLAGFNRNRHGQCVRIFSKKIQNFKADLDIPNEINQKVQEDVTEAPLKHLSVSVVSKSIRLPEKETSLSAYAIPDEKTSGDTYSYTWTVISQPAGDNNGTITDQTKDKVKLSNLSEGLYQLKVVVTSSVSYGEAYANVSVIPEKKINKPPDVIITPTHQTVKLPTSEAILDGSTSKDDDSIVTWHWEVIKGPIGYQPTLPETSTLHLTDLTTPGNYTFKLTVTDTYKIQNSSTAQITVVKIVDYPPQSNPGPDVIVYLPHNKVTLNGSLSSDDHEIVAWEWTKDSNEESKAVDMQNTRTPFLELSNLEEGIYIFELKVSDASNQSNTSQVRVFVKPPTNLPPVANAGKNMTINLPKTWSTLNGSQSLDDIEITRYYWKQLSGPTNSIIANANASIANATALTVGQYAFQLTVVDASYNNATDTVFITVVQEKNTAPIANGGGDQSVTLPISVIILNGTKSSDDLSIEKYLWTRDSSSLAIGTIVGNSFNEPILMLTNVVPGRYVFCLTVTDAQGLTGTDTVSVIVHADPLALNLVELTLTTGVSVLTKSEEESLEQKLILLLGDNIEIHVRELKVEQKNGEAVVIFYVERKNRDGNVEIMSGLEVEKILKDKFWRDAGILGTFVSDIRTTVCQHKCSGHGICNSETRACMCATFWMPDIFYFWGIGEPNCDWSILYVIIGVFIGFLILSGICWGITCMCRRNYKPRNRSTKPQKYLPLGTHEDEMPAFARGGIGGTLSDSETEDDVLFESRIKHNGILKNNGDVRNGAPKYTTTRLGRRIKT